MNAPIAAPKSRLPRIRLELRALMTLALPMMIAQLASTAMGFVDAVMAGRFGPNDLAAVALGNSIWVPVYLLMTGTLLATTPKVAQHFGAGTPERIGPLVRQALWLALVVGSLGSLMLLSAEPVLHWMKVDAHLIGPCMNYLYGIACGLPAAALAHVLRCYCDGQGRTRPAMVVGLCGLALNIPINYMLMYGHVGLPPLGGVGCGWASGIVMWCVALSLLAWVRWAPTYRVNQLFSRFDWPDRVVVLRLLNVGLPIGIAIFAEVSVFCVIALLIGSLGASVVAGHQIALNVSSLLFMIPLSLGTAVTVRVGQALGASQPREARFAVGVGMATALVCACFSASMMLLFRENIASVYTADRHVIQLASSLLVYAALFQFSDALQVIAAAALRGYQDTRVTMLLILFAYWGIGLPLGYTLGMTDLLGAPSGPSGLWQGLIAALTCAAAMLSLRLVSSARKSIHRKVAA